MEGVMTEMPIITAEEKAQRRLKVKARSTLMMGIPNEHQLKFNLIKDAKKLLKALELLDEKILQEDVNQKLLRSLSPEWNTHAVVWRNKADLDTMSMDDLYNNLKARMRAPRNQDNKNKESSRRSVPVETSTFTALVSCDGLGGYDWSDQAEERPNYALMAFSSSSPDSEKSELMVLGEITIREVKKKLEIVQKEKDGIQLNVDKFEHASKSFNKFIECQIVDNCKKGLGYENYNAIPPPYTGNFMPPTPDLSFTGLDEFVNEPVVENYKAMSSEEEPKIGNPQIDLQDQGVIDSGCSRHVTGNMSYHTDYEERDGGYVAFGGNPKGGKIIEKVPLKLGSLVRDLPSKLFENDQTCVACQKRKQHRASCKSKIENSINLPLHLLHMDLFGPIFVKSLKKKMYCLVVTDDYSRFTWVFFLATNDETSVILKSFITGIENLVDHKVKVIRSDNGTEFKNREMNQFCEMKGILRQFSVARTPQQNGVAERRNRILIAITPTLRFMRPFWCPVTILNTIDHLGKFDGKVDKGSGPDWLFDIDALTRIMNYEPIVAGTQSNDFAGTKASDNAGQARKETEPVKDYILLPLWTADPPYSQDPKSFHNDGSKPSSDDGRKVDEDPRKDSEYKDQEKEDNVNSTNNVNTADNVNTVSSTVNVVGTNKVNDVGGKTSIELPCDPNMPALEDDSIFDFLRDDEDDGAVADMNNLDKTIQVSPNSTIRIHKDRPLNQVIGDLQSTTQTGKMLKNLEEHGFVRRTQKGNSCIEGSKLDRGYAGRASTIQVTRIYVDDIIFGSTKKELCIAFEKLIHEKFQMSSMGELTFFLGLQVKQKKDSIFISQDKYVAKILKKFGFTEVKTASTPMGTQKPLLKDEDGEEVDVHMYRSMIGSLMYLTSSRPDIMFAVCACARY
ncbi:putative ribonuclease H-like domain-containing protein [Tanacetum coccineum]